MKKVSTRVAQQSRKMSSQKQSNPQLTHLSIAASGNLAKTQRFGPDHQ